MFGRKHKHLKILMHRYGATVYQDGRYLHIDAKLSTKSQRDLGTLRDLIEALDEVAKSTKKIVTPHPDEVTGLDP